MSAVAFTGVTFTTPAVNFTSSFLLTLNQYHHALGSCSSYPPSCETCSDDRDYTGATDPTAAQGFGTAATFCASVAIVLQIQAFSTAHVAIEEQSRLRLTLSRSGQAVWEAPGLHDDDDMPHDPLLSQAESIP